MEIKVYGLMMSLIQKHSNQRLSEWKSILD